MEVSDEEEQMAIDVVPSAMRICLIGPVSQDPEVVEAAHKFGFPVEFSDSGTDVVNSDEDTVVFVVNDFFGEVFDTLRSNNHRIMGPTALKELASEGQPIPDLFRPLYNLAMKDVIVCFTGFRVKEELARMVFLVHSMGGSIRKDAVVKVTHLIANTCVSEKYQYATTFRLPILSADWINHAWSMRDSVGFKASQNVVEHKLKPFQGARVCFLGFPEEEQKHMAEILVANGGTQTDIEDRLCSHVVVDSAETYELITKDTKSSPSAKRRREGSLGNSPVLLDLTQIVEPAGCSTPKSHLVGSKSIKALDESVGGLNTSMLLDPEPPLPDVNRTPCSKEKGAMFKTPRLNAVRRSLRIRTPTMLSKWMSSLDVSLTKSPVRAALPSPSPTHAGQQDILNSPQSSGQGLHLVMSHLVVDESTVSTLPQQAPSRACIVKAEWFWASVQNELCAYEKDYLFKESQIGSTSGSIRVRKRKRFRQQLSLSGSPALDSTKRRSSITDATLLSCSGSFLDASPHPDIKESESDVEETPKTKLSPRQQVYLELVQTESNYVGILNTIVTLFKGPLEAMLEGEDPLLNATELKIIFGNLPPIYHAHSRMLEELRYAAQHWNEEVSVGNIFLKYANDFLKAYPPFINFFENTREMLNKCDETKPRFHAFLKVGQTRAECGRQSLQELLIRPVQRLPSISLLLNDILKHTNKSNPDHAALEKALNSVKEVMTHINEDKRKTEGQLVMFDIFNEIGNCPAHLVSSHRNFITRCEVTELSDGISGRGDSLVLFLFTDVMEVCKKRSKAKSPNPTISGRMNHCKPYKHIKLLSLATIKRVIDVLETEDCHKVFALMCRSTQDLKEKLYSFTIVDDETDKMTFLKTLCRHIANNACMTDSENFLASLDPQTLDIETSDVCLGTLGKAFKFASKTRMKVGRALSFNKTPSKLKRAMSTVMSPFGSTTNIAQTPSAQLAQMRLASCTNISELASSNSPLSESQPQYVTPLSVPPTRRNKHSTLSVASLRRL